MQGLVYYMLDATRRTQYLKIGYTTNLKQRVVDLRGITASGQCPTVLALEDGSHDLERERHDQFTKHRSHGEWFRFEGELVDFIAEMEHPFSYLLDRPHLWQWSGGWGPLGQGASGQKPFGWAPLPPVDF